MPRQRSHGCAISGLVALTGLVLLGSAAALGSDLFAAALLAAALPLPLYMAVALWVDRFEPEPRGLLAMTFLWGASAAVLASGLVNSFADGAIGEPASATVAAPVFEEIFKGLALLYLFARRRDEFDGVVDGIVYAAMVGLGFAFVENIEYYGRALQTDGAHGLAVTVTLRGVIGPYSHPLFSSMFGLGLGLARQTERVWLRRAAPAMGLAAAILLHALWNAGALAGCVFFAVYGFIMLPALGGIMAVLAWSLRREGAILRERLRPEFEQGLLPGESYVEVCSARRRLRSSTTALLTGGPRAWRQARRVHHAAAELALLRHRVARGLHLPEPDLEQTYLRTLVPGYVAPAPALGPPAAPVAVSVPDEQPPPHQ